MLKKAAIIVTGIVVFGAAVITILYAISDEPFSYSQNFYRVHRQDVVQQRNVMDLKDNSYYIAGGTANQIFFGTEKDSLDLLITDTLLSTTKHVRLSLEPKENLELKGSRIEIDSPFFYIKAGQVPGIFRGTMDHWRAKRILDSIVFFDQAVLLTKNSVAFQATGGTEESATSQNILCKISTDTEEVKLNTEILEAQVDNYFSTLGMLRYSKKLNQLVYTYFYRNQYLVIDTSLNLQYKASTIDTVSQAHIKPVEVSKGNYTLASTPAIVNRNAQIYENLLLIHSNLMASNETKEIFDNVSVIDAYDIKTSRYLFSFHLPDYKSIKLDTFKVIKDRIIAKYGRYLISYSFNAQSFAKPVL